jgi:hypothetical protein
MINTNNANNMNNINYMANSNNIRSSLKTIEDKVNKLFKSID